ncbi:MAG: Holliday junction branch migration protein RuvA [Atopobiaceae bacterium]|jgi:Holliday junction DNA helicase RuvA|nr:Holliday junction branch migration protein RuvA [Atopobiaceae bacterium]MCH4180555.1 Holliday junction branch migration protein RuvA [Atopobiaceae bacterium]MCH4214280.1 Holliday junction branch migration protein RuvA [Atopobiaceae bacterium]MCH4229423.1 Holliday junction branch migration protein RuvA [Atopobiaceae bacterium]MCH4276105.1 Holliday junction branch migration protein RuvA [Atopobiaceae bacterium]
MIVQLTGTLIEAAPTHVVLDVAGVGYELGISATTAAELPAVGEAGVTLLVRMLVREDGISLYGFSSREERALFDRLCAIAGVGPKLALSVLSTFSPAALANVVDAKDASLMSSVPGVGRKKADRLILELEGVFAQDADLAALVGAPVPTRASAASSVSADPVADVTAALLSMGFTQQEADLALDGHEEAGATGVSGMLAFALHRLGGGA